MHSVGKLDRVILSCTPVLEKRVPIAHVSLQEQMLNGRKCEVVQVLCAEDHSKLDAKGDHAAKLVCPCCISDLGAPNFKHLRVGQTMKLVEDEWITHEGEA